MVPVLDMGSDMEGLAGDRSKAALAAIQEEGEEEEEGLVLLLLVLLWESMGGGCLLQNSMSILSSAFLPQVGVGLLDGGLICKDRSGCAGKSSILSVPATRTSTD